ncbi:manganese-dependent ADP-ribose/CDP-alcohol diphosphatase-like [Gigantopelta aegis]|uniref:manganese-dependent ADP-ribose/CDP-alcohol diphosphatase-like n=1 Tax=Gigantopelta aegis TaxID=1735272 RepID=UPI001B88B318|nr:manganese-dependent ADP-ribose/CDP-alcohol diphosphatase-like [Gigantopelta aegis]
MSCGDPVLTFGIIADVQYADEDNGRNFLKTRTRYYRNSLNILHNAVNHWRQVKPRVDFILQLGDHIDGICKRKGSDVGLRTALGPLISFGKPVYHVIGNHELYNFSREQFIGTELFSAGREECDSPAVGCLYYSFQPHPAVRVVALDCYDVSLIGNPKDSDKYREAMEIIREKNTNEDLASPLGLPEENMRFVTWNGGLSSRQLSWLQTEVQEAEKLRQNVIVFGHLPLFQPTSDCVNLCWNAEDVVDVLHQHSCVVCYLCGHNHDGGDAVDGEGILHVTMPGVVERGPGEDAFATASLHRERLDIAGQGAAGSFSVNLRYPIS